MGIDFDPKTCTVRHNSLHEERVVTDPARNPSAFLFGKPDVHVACIFRRVKSRYDGDDGNPLVYAMKRKFGYKIGRSCLDEIEERIDQILPNAIAGFTPHIIVPIPSSAYLVTLFARRVAALRPNSQILVCLAKNSVGRALATLPQVEEVPTRLQGDLKTLRNRWQKAPQGSHVEMKGVPTALREYVQSVYGTNAVAGCAGKSVLIVEDSITTGTTVVSAHAAIMAAGAVEARVVSLFSPLPGPNIRRVRP